MVIGSSTVIPIGVEFVVNTTTVNDQSGPSVAALSGGRFVVAWEDNSPLGAAPGSTEIRAQIFDENGDKSGSEFLVNSTETSDQVSPTSAKLADGRFVFAWGDNSQSGGDTSGWSVRAQMFNDDGSPFGDEFLANTTTTGNQFSVSTTALSDGRFVLTWSDDSGLAGDTVLGAIRAQVFNANGSPSGSEFLVNTATVGDQLSAEITALAEGRFVVTWYDSSHTGADTSEWAIRAQIFNSDGSKFGVELLVNTTTSGSQILPVISSLSDGRFVVLWQDSSDSATRGLVLKAQIFNADGSKSGGEFPITSAIHDEDQLSVAPLSAGRFIVSWTDHSSVGGDTSLGSIKAKVFNADGTPSGDEFLVNSTILGSQERPSTTALSDGRLVVSWQDHSQTGSDTSGAAIRAQILDPDGMSLNLTGTPDNDNLIGAEGNDTISGLGGHDLLQGNAGDDFLVGGAGNDSLIGGAGSDTVSFGDAFATVLVGETGGGLNIGTSDGNDFVADDVEFFQFSDRLVSYAEVAALDAPEAILGTDTAENVVGTSSREQINALGGADWITPGGGSDTIDGGDGNDMVSFVNLADTPGRTNVQYRLDIDLTAGTAVNHDGSEQLQISNVERITGTIFADRIKGDAGDNHLRGLGDYDWFTGTTGNDTLEGGTGQDMVSYVDWLNTDANVADDFFSDAGVPPPSAQATGVVVDLNDTSNNTHLAAGHTYDSIERITGSGRQDVFYGDDSENDFRGLGDYDWFVGSTGGRERYFGGDGIDTVTYYNSTSGVIANLRNGALVNGEETGYGTGGDAARDLYFEMENLIGTNFDDSLTGNAGRNQLSGLDGDDFIFGYGGIDQLKGGLGNDTLNGGGSSDYAIYDGNADDYTLTRTASNLVTVTGAEGTDSLIDIEYFRFADDDVTIWELDII